MKRDGAKAATIDEYIALHPESAERLSAIRSLIREEVPEGVEAIKYDIPTFRWNDKNLVHFAAFKKHLSVFPIFAEMEIPGMEPHLKGRGTAQFPNHQELPLELIRTAVRLLKQRAEQGMRD